jgi:hypothetical protein
VVVHRTKDRHINPGDSVIFTKLEIYINE